MKVSVQQNWSRYRPGVAQRVGRGIALLFHDRGTRRWVSGQQHAPAALYPREATRYEIEGPRIKSREWRNVLDAVQTTFESHPTSCQRVPGSFMGQSDWGMVLTIQTFLPVGCQWFVSVPSVPSRLSMTNGKTVKYKVHPCTGVVPTGVRGWSSTKLISDIL